MKTFLLFVALLVAPAAFAAPPTPAQLPLIDHMIRECLSVMGKEVCRVLIDAEKCKGAANVDACQRQQFRDKYPKGLIVAGAGRFTADEYFLYAGAGDRMCDVIVRECSVDYDGRGCGMGRALWRQR